MAIHAEGAPRQAIWHSGDLEIRNHERAGNGIRCPAAKESKPETLLCPPRDSNDTEAGIGNAAFLRHEINPRRFKLADNSSLSCKQARVRLPLASLILINISRR